MMAANKVGLFAFSRVSENQCWGSGSGVFRPPRSGSISQRDGSGSGSESFSFLIKVFSRLK
jgi:hypothetical protein